MAVKYLRCYVFHPRKKGTINVDIKIESPNESRVDLIKTLASTSDDFIDSGLSLGWTEEELKFFDQQRSQSGYVGTSSEIIRQIINKFG